MPDEFELTVDRVVAGGDGLGRDHDGRVVFVGGALPGEKVRVERSQTKRSYVKARLIEVLEPAAERQAPPCPYVGRGCGGCTWQHITPAAQRELKRTIVEDALRHIGGFAEPPPIDLGPDLPTTAFRTTVRCAVVDGRAGFRHYHSHDVVPVDHCLVAHPLIDDLIDRGRFEGCDEVTLRCGVATGERLVLPSPEVASIDVPADVGIGVDAAIHEDVAGRRWRISARSFFQARPDGAAALVKAVSDAASVSAAPTARLVDLYCGVGLFAGTIAADHVTAVESSASAVRDARHNLADFNANVIRADVAKWRPSRADLVIADPARAGLGKAAVTRIVATGASVVVLVSCDPASLGRDAALLNREGYALDSCTLIDLFPHAPHVEVVSRFRRVDRVN